MGVAMLVSTVFVYSCNKEEKENLTGKIENQVAPTKQNNHNGMSQPVSPQFIYRPSIEHGSCCLSSGYMCGFDVTVLSGDEACALYGYLCRLDLEEDPRQPGTYRAEYFTLPVKYLIDQKATELIDSAKFGAMTFDADCMFKSEELIKLTGTDLIPAGRYPVKLLKEKGEQVVRIDFRKML